MDSATTFSGGKDEITCRPVASFLQVVKKVIDMKNQIIVFNTHAEIVLTYRNGDEKGRAKIDINDIDLVSPYRWFYSATNYVSANVDGRRIMLHRFLLSEPAEHIDHINGEPSDNRRANIRTATQSQNMMNRIAENGDMRGVEKNGNRWMASIKSEGTSHYLGLYETLAEAMAARQAGERILFGEFNRREYDDCA